MTRDELLDYLWRAGSQATLRPRLAQILHMTRQKLGCPEAITEVDRHLVLSPERFSTDLAAFDDALRRGDFQEALDSLSLGFLSELPGSPTHAISEWVEDRHIQLRSRLRGLLGQALQQAQDQADFHRVTELCSLQLQLDPDDEAALQRLLRAYGALGKPGLADSSLEAFSNARKAHEPEWSPSEETQSIWRSIKILRRPSGISRPESINSGGTGRPLIGRTEEASLIRQALTRDRATSHAFVTVSGGRGIGKTHLCESVLDTLAYQGYPIFRNYAVPRTSPYAYELLYRLLEDIAATCREEDLQHGDVPHFPFSGPGAPPEPFLYRHSCEILARAVEMHGEFIVFVDDIHHADTESVRMLDLLWRSRQHTGFSVLATLPTLGDAPVALSRMLFASPLHISVSLEPFDGPISAAFVESLIPLAQDGLKREVTRQSGGIPKIIKSFCETVDRLQVDSDGTITIPSEAQCALAHLLSAAPRHTSHVLAVLLVESHEWSLGRIGDCLGVGLMDIVRATEFLCHMGIVERHGQTFHIRTQGFHNFARQSMSDGLPLTRRRCALYLEHHHSNPEILVEAWDLAGESGKTVHYARDASSRAALRGDIHRNVAHLRRGLRHARATSEEPEFQALLGNALVSARQMKEAVALLDAASESAWAQAKPSQWIDIQIQLIDARGHIPGSDAGQCAQGLLELVDTAIHHACIPEAARALDRALHYYHRVGDDVGARRVFRKAKDLLGQVKDPLVHSLLHATLAMKAYYGEPNCGTRHAALAVGSTNAACEPKHRLFVLNRRLAVLLAVGRLRLEEGRTTVQEALRLADSTADLLQRAHLQINVAVWEADCGNWGGAVRQLERLMPALKSPDDRRPLILALCNLGLALLRSGRFAESGEVLEEGHALLTDWDSQEVLAQFRAGLGWVALEQGRPGEARRRLDELDAMGLPKSIDLSTITLFRARYYRRTRQLHLALEVLDRAIQETADRFPVHHVALICERERYLSNEDPTSARLEERSQAIALADSLCLHEWSRELKSLSR